MKALLRLLVVCSVTLALISPVLVVWKVWQNHSEFVNAQRVVSPEQRLGPQQVVSTTNFGESCYLRNRVSQCYDQSMRVAKDI
jgi:hypothetical protein